MMKDTSLTQMSSETCECYSFRNVLFSWWHDGEYIVALYELTDRHIRCYPTKRSNTGYTSRHVCGRLFHPWGTLSSSQSSNLCGKVNALLHGLNNSSTNFRLIFISIASCIIANSI